MQQVKLKYPFLLAAFFYAGKKTNYAYKIQAQFKTALALPAVYVLSTKTQSICMVATANLYYFYNFIYPNFSITLITLLPLTSN